MTTVDCSAETADFGRWGVAHKAWFDYEEIRPIQLFLPSASHRIVNDCSGTVCLWFWLAGAPDPMGFNYSNPIAGEDEGNSDTLAQHGTPVASAMATKTADVVVYWPSWDTNCTGTSEHTALIVQGGVSDPLTVSHGQQSEPGFVTVSQDGRPHRFYRFNTTKPAPAPPVLTEDDPMFLVQNPHNKGWCLLHGDRWSGVPNPNALAALHAQSLKTITLTVAQFDTLVQVGWGSA